MTAKMNRSRRSGRFTISTAFSRISKLNTMRVKFRQLIPPEHGVWGFLGAAVGAGIGVAPTVAGSLIAAGLIVGVVARHAGQLALSGVRVWPAAVGLGVTCACAWTWALWLAPDAWPWLAGAAALTVLQLSSVAGSRRHGTAGVLVGGVALALVGGGIAATGVPMMIAQRTNFDAEIVTSAVIGYLICVTPLVRARRQPNSPWKKHALAGHLVAAVSALSAAWLGVAPASLACYFMFLLVRCLWLTRTRTGLRAATPKTIGLAELPPLILLVVATVVGIRSGW